MKRSRMWIALDARVVLMTLLLPLPSATGQPSPTLDDVRQKEADVVACKSKLNRIFEGIQQFQTQNHRLPKSFAELHPEIIADGQVFMCPVVLRISDLRSWKTGVLNGVFLDPSLLTSYTYEFGEKEIQLAPGVSPTYLEFKKRQMALVGNVVPIVRCFAHGPDMVLNLSIGGRVYPSGRYWENEFTNSVSASGSNKPISHDDFAEYRIFRDLLLDFLDKPRSYPARSAQTSPRLLDLTGSYNFRLDETVRFKSASGSDFSDLPRGVVTFKGFRLAFDVRGRIQVAGQGLRLPFPDHVKGIKVDQSFRELHFLCGTIKNSPRGTEIGKFEVHYVDGRSNHIPIVYGQDVLDWSSDPQQPDTGTLRKIWHGVSTVNQGPNQPVSLFHVQWQNPLPDLRVNSLDFVSTLTAAAPFVIAITLD